jgi:hypothetical protein
MREKSGVADQALSKLLILAMDVGPWRCVFAAISRQRPLSRHILLQEDKQSHVCAVLVPE